MPQMFPSPLLPKNEKKKNRDQTLVLFSLTFGTVEKQSLHLTVAS